MRFFRRLKKAWRLLLRALSTRRLAKHAEHYLIPPAVMPLLR